MRTEPAFKMNKNQVENFQIWYTLDSGFGLSAWIFIVYQPSGAKGTRSPPAKSKMAARGPKMADGVWMSISRLLGVLSNFR